MTKSTKQREIQCLPSALLAAVALATGHLMASSETAKSEELLGRASVIDADTIEIHGQRIRFHGVDAPEGRQTCFMPDGSPWRCGQRGALALADYIGNSPVTCRRVDTDRYRRMVATCKVGGEDLGRWLVSQGWAMAYTKYSSAYVEVEREARSKKRGIWQGTVQAPWDWRRRKR